MYTHIANNACEGNGSIVGCQRCVAFFLGGDGGGGGGGGPITGGIFRILAENSVFLWHICWGSCVNLVELINDAACPSSLKGACFGLSVLNKLAMVLFLQAPRLLSTKSRVRFRNILNRTRFWEFFDRKMVSGCQMQLMAGLAQTRGIEPFSQQQECSCSFSLL